MDDITQSTDVGNNTPVAVAEESTSAAAAPVSQEETSQTATAGDVTAQSVIEATASETEGTVDPTQEDDPLKDIPTLEELEQNKTQQYAQALINLRTAYEARKNELGESQGKLNSVQPLLEQYGDTDTIQARLAAYDSLFTPVVNPDTQQPEVDEQGFPKITTSPFIEQMDSENPGLAEQLLRDLLRYAPEDQGGQKVPLWVRTIEAFGLDPQRLEDYRNINALAAPSTGEVTTEELEAIPKELHEAYKSLSADVREDLKEAKPAARDQYLRDRQEVLETKKFREEQSRLQADAQQQQFAEARQRISQEQDGYVSSQLQQAHASIMDEVARQVTFSADSNENSKMLGITGAFIFALRDPDFAPLAESALNAFGTKLDSSFHEELSVADKHMRDFKAYELMGQKGLAQQSLTKANAAKTKVMAKVAPLAMKVAKALGGQASQRAGQQNQLLNQATTTRPTPGLGGTQAEPNGYGIPGMLPNDPRYGVELARRTGLLG